MRSARPTCVGWLSAYPCRCSRLPDATRASSCTPNGPPEVSPLIDDFHELGDAGTPMVGVYAQQFAELATEFLLAGDGP